MQRIRRLAANRRYLFESEYFFSDLAAKQSRFMSTLVEAKTIWWDRRSSDRGIYGLGSLGARTTAGVGDGKQIRGKFPRVHPAKKPSLRGCVCPADPSIPAGRRRR